MYLKPPHLGRQMDSEDEDVPKHKRPKLKQGKENAEEYVVMFNVNLLYIHSIAKLFQPLTKT